MGNKDGGGAGMFVAGLLIGGAIGATVALLYAPQRGDETRDYLKQKSNEYSDVVKTKAGDLSEAAKTKANEFSSKANEVAGTVRTKTSELTESAKAKAQDLTESVKSKAGETLSAVKDSAQTLADRGRSLLNQQKDRLDDAIDAGKLAAQDKEQELKASVEATG
jgi:gas vesicle protein